jgi:hypothetical protein
LPARKKRAANEQLAPLEILTEWLFSPLHEGESGLKVHLAIALAVVATVATAQTAPAPPQHIDISTKLINVPDSNWSAYGPDQTSKQLDKGGPQNYPALEVSVSRAGKNAWDDGAVSPVPKAIAAGDVILVAVYLRNPNLADGQTETLPLVGATGAAAPYPAIAGAPANVTNQWKIFFASGKAPQAFPAGGAQVTVHLSSAKHVIQLGPIRIYDFGPDFDLKRLPH